MKPSTRIHAASKALGSAQSAEEHLKAAIAMAYALGHADNELGVDPKDALDKLVRLVARVYEAEEAHNSGEALMKAFGLPTPEATPPKTHLTLIKGGKSE
jgi:hypothetical protein